MKFTKDDARKELMSKIPSKGQTLNLSERSINEILDTLMPLLANDETELTDFITKVLPAFQSADGNVKNDVSVSIKEYKSKHPENQITLKPESDKSGGDNPSEDLAKALERIAELERKNAENEQRSLISNRRAEIISKMREKGCKDSGWINELLEEVNLGEKEFDADSRVEKYIKIYNKSMSDAPKDITPKTPSEPSGEDKELTDVINAAANFVKNSRLE